MKLDEAKLLDALTMAAVGRKPFSEHSPGEQREVRDMARALCVELARQGHAWVRGTSYDVRTLADALEAAFLPPKREPDVEAAVVALRGAIYEMGQTRCGWQPTAGGGGGGCVRNCLLRALRALGVEEDGA